MLYHALAVVALIGGRPQDRFDSKVAVAGMAARQVGEAGVGLLLIVGICPCVTSRRT